MSRVTVDGTPPSPHGGQIVIGALDRCLPHVGLADQPQLGGRILLRGLDHLNISLG